MNILAVHPPYPGNREIVYLPLGLGYISAVAEREGHEITVVDMHNLRLSYGALESALERREYQACFMGGFAMQVVYAAGANPSGNRPRVRRVQTPASAARRRSRPRRCQPASPV